MNNSKSFFSNSLQYLFNKFILAPKEFIVKLALPFFVIAFVMKFMIRNLNAACFDSNSSHGLSVSVSLGAILNQGSKQSILPGTLNYYENVLNIYKTKKKVRFFAYEV